MGTGMLGLLRLESLLLFYTKIVRLVEPDGGHSARGEVADRGADQGSSGDMIPISGGLGVRECTFALMLPTSSGSFAVTVWVKDRRCRGYWLVLGLRLLRPPLDGNHDDLPGGRLHSQPEQEQGNDPPRCTGERRPSDPSRGG